MKRKIAFIVLSFVLVLSYGRGYHVTVDGKSTGDGSINNPWDLATAFNRNNPIKPSGGDTVFIHKGIHVGTPHIWFGGKLNNHVVITNWQNDVAVIDGNTGVDDAAVIYIQAEGGGYVTIDGLTITNSHPERTTTTTGSFPPYPQNMAGIQSASDNYEIKNCIIHDNHGNGIGAFGGNATITGNLIYYNGWDAPDRGHCYGLYVQNADPAQHTYIKNNIIFSNFSKGFHVYVTKGTIITNINIIDNIIFEAGLPSSVGATENNIFVGGLRPLVGIKIDGNHTYLNQEIKGISIRVGYYEQENIDIKVTNNYAIGGAQPVSIRYCKDILFSHNKVVGGSYIYGGLVDWFGSEADKETYTVDSNSLFYKGKRNDYLMDTNWLGWTSSLGFDSNGAIAYTNPQRNEYFIKKLEGSKWANLVVYDWEGKGSVDVDLNSIVGTNDVPYEIYDVQNIEGEPIVTGKYSGGNVSIPTNLKAVTPVVGSDVPTKAVHTDQKFNVYIIKSDQFISADDKVDVPSDVPSDVPVVITADVTPNPTDGLVTVNFSISGECNNAVNADLLSPSGVVLDSKEDVTSGFGFNITSVCPMDCASGLYSVVLKCGSNLNTTSFQYFKERTFRIISYQPNPIPKLENLEHITYKAKKGSVINWELKSDVGESLEKGKFNTDTKKVDPTTSYYKWVLNFGSRTEGVYLLYMDDGFSKDSCKVNRR